MFQHFVITRFNLRPTDPGATMDDEVSDRWMKERVRIFEDFCYASVKGQKNQSFIWLVFFDVTTHSRYMETITRLAKEYTNFVPVYVAGVEQFLPGLKLEVAERASSEYIITSRLDNDDCLHENYVDAIQSQFNSQAFLAVNFINGITLDVVGTPRCGYRIHANNPFISLIEKRDSLVTVYSRSHGQWGKIRWVKDVRNHEPLWLSLVHGKNILNEYIGFGRVGKSTLERFNIAPLVLEALCDEMIENHSVSSLKNRYAAYLHYSLKKIRNKVRSLLSLIPDK